MDRIKKKVTFNEEVQVFQLYVWKFAYREARKSVWINESIDRMRFEHRIKKIEEILNPILKEKLTKVCTTSK